MWACADTPSAATLWQLGLGDGPRVVVERPEGSDTATLHVALSNKRAIITDTSANVTDADPDTIVAGDPDGNNVIVLLGTAPDDAAC